MFMRTQRLFLRPIWPEDRTELLAGACDDVVARNLGQVAWAHAVPPARDLSGLARNPRLPHLLVTRPDGVDGAEAVGCVGLHEERGEVRLGYWIARAHSGRGYATEAARGLLSLARLLGHGRILARHFLDNPASGRVLRKLGFCPTGDSAVIVGPHRGARVQVMALDLDMRRDCDDVPGPGAGGGAQSNRQAA